MKKTFVTYGVVALIALLFLLPSACKDTIIPPPPPDPGCDPNATKQMPNELILVNSPWNPDGLTYKECIFKREENGQTVYGWNWEWPHSDGSSVRGYPNILFGNSVWGGKSPTTRLPALIGSITQMDVHYQLTSSATGIYNLAFDAWVIDDKWETNPDINNIVAEVMVWTRNSGMSPPASSQKISNAVTGYDLYKWAVNRNGLHWTYLAFLPWLYEPTDSREIHFAEFLYYLAQHQYISVNDYLASLEFGNELVEGSGETKITDYSITLMTTSSPPNLAGTWQGALIQPGGPYQLYDFKMSLSQKNYLVTGTSRIGVPSTSYYGEMQLSGSINGDTLAFKETSILSQHRPPFVYWCIKTGKLGYSAVGDSLVGPWSGVATGGTCVPGTIKLHRTSN